MYSYYYNSLYLFLLYDSVEDLDKTALKVPGVSDGNTSCKNHNQTVQGYT